jgi:catechol 2,3-dioxygenase-like lactoylglutathione lyase family enzyme
MSAVSTKNFMSTFPSMVFGAVMSQHRLRRKTEKVQDMILDHIGFGVGDYEHSRAFYSAALAPLGIVLVMEIPAEANVGGHAAAGYGRGGEPLFWIGAEGRTEPVMHVAFAARSRAEVDGFHAAALAAGAQDNGAPGLRPQYHPHYYAAFILDPDGHNIEAVCHTPA